MKPLWWVLGLLTLCAVTTAPPPHASAATGGDGTQGASGVTLPVQAYSTPLHAVSATSYKLRAGDRRALDTPDMAFSIDSWGKGRPTDIATTLLLTCTDPAGRPALRAHDGANLTPDEPDRTPDIRALLVAHKSGTYRCALRASASSTAHAPGMTVRLAGRQRIDGARGVTSTRVGRDATTWTRPADLGDLLLAPGTTAEPMTTRARVGRAAPLGPTRLDIAVDAEVTTCNRAEAYAMCGSRNPKAAGGELTSWLQVQGLDEAGKPVGEPYRSPERTRTVSAAKHHAMLHHTVPVYAPRAVRQLEITLKARVGSGDHMVFHAGYGYARGVLTKPPSASPGPGAEEDDGDW